MSIAVTRPIATTVATADSVLRFFLEGIVPPLALELRDDCVVDGINFKSW
jgi:hypothetical protein